MMVQKRIRFLRTRLKQQATDEMSSIYFILYTYSVYIKYTLFIHLPSRSGRDGEWAAFLANDDDTDDDG